MPLEDNQTAKIPLSLSRNGSQEAQQLEERCPDADFRFFRGLVVALGLSALAYSALWFFLL